MATKLVSVDVKGGNALLRHLASIRTRLGMPAGVAVGFLEDATYPAALEQKSMGADRAKLGKVTGKNAKRRAAKAAASGLHVAQVAFWNEFGTSRAPARPFFRNMVASKSPRWGIQLGAQLRSTNYNSELALTRMGTLMSSQLQTSILQLKSPSLAPYTIAQKGFDKPLIDTAVMLRSVDFQVLTDEAE